MHMLPSNPDAQGHRKDKTTFQSSPVHLMLGGVLSVLSFGLWLLLCTLNAPRIQNASNYGPRDIGGDRGVPLDEGANSDILRRCRVDSCLFPFGSSKSGPKVIRTKVRATTRGAYVRCHNRTTSTCYNARCQPRPSWYEVKGRRSRQFCTGTRRLP